MKYVSNKMLALMERLSEMFPGSSYQTRLDQYLSSKGITDAAQLEKLATPLAKNSYGQYLLNLLKSH